MYFSDFFEIDEDVIESYGALNISLINDLPLFIDPFLLFNSERNEYQELHRQIIDYLIFLRDQSTKRTIPKGLLLSWYCFHEVKQNWLGFSSVGNSGSGLGLDFAVALNSNLSAIFTDFGNEKIAKGSHLEKLCLIKSGVGRDNISDFTTNLIKDYLLEYTQKFSTMYLDAKYIQKVRVSRAIFKYSTQSWYSKEYLLPVFKNDYVILTPKDMLTGDENWISRPDMFERFPGICASLPDESLRAQLDDYFKSVLPKNPKKDDYNSAIDKTISAFPAFIEHYIRLKEDTGDQAVLASEQKIGFTQQLFIDQVKGFIAWLMESTEFYKKPKTTYEESLEKVLYLKHVIEDNDGYRVFYFDGKPIGSEKDLQLIFRLTWFETLSDVNSEVNNGRGPVDYKISRGKNDSTLVEFKLASNSKLKKNIENQVEVYQKANKTKNKINVIMYFTQEELGKVSEILLDLGLADSENIILIDARADNKPSASNATSA